MSDLPPGTLLEWHRLTFKDDLRTHIVRTDALEIVVEDIQERHHVVPMAIERLGPVGACHPAYEDFPNDRFVFDYGGSQFADAPLVVLGRLDGLEICVRSTHHIELLLGLTAAPTPVRGRDICKLHCAWLTLVCTPEDIEWIIERLQATSDEARVLAAVENERLRILLAEMEKHPSFAPSVSHTPFEKLRPKN